MAVNIMQNVFEYSQAKGNDRLLLLSIGDNAGSDGFAHPGYKHLTSKMNATRETVKSCIVSMELSGELYVNREKRHNRYIVLPGLTDEQIEKALRLHFGMDGKTARSTIGIIREKQTHQSKVSTKRKKRNQSRLSTNANQSKVSTGISLYLRPVPVYSLDRNHQLTVNLTQSEVLLLESRESVESDKGSSSSFPPVIEIDFNFKRVSRHYESAIGGLNPVVSEQLKTACDEYPHDWIIEAIDMAVAKGKRFWGYAEGILKQWKANGKDNSNGTHQQGTGSLAEPTLEGTRSRRRAAVGRGQSASEREKAARDHRRAIADGLIMPDVSGNGVRDAASRSRASAVRETPAMSSLRERIRRAAEADQQNV